MKRRNVRWISAHLGLILACQWGYHAHTQEPEFWYIDKFSGEARYYTVPLKITDFQWEPSEIGTIYTIAIKSFGEIPHNAVYTLEIHYADFMVVYNHNYPDIPGASGPSTVDILTRHGAHRLGSGEIHYYGDTIEIAVPIQTEEIPSIVIMRYLPTQSDAEEAIGGLHGAIVSYLWIKRNIKGAIPGWPYQAHWQQSQQGRTVSWQPRNDVSVPTDSSDRPRLGDRVRGGNNRIWPRDISLLPDDGAVDLGGGRLIEWGLEQGWFPYGGYDGTDAWVGLVGIDQNGDGRLQPGEVTGVIGRCGPNGADNDFYVDGQGYVHWINYDENGKINHHYIYDPSRDILKIYDSKGNLIYMDPPTGWKDKI
ncbi:MAG: hypothetical protein KatS3mg018_0150 [Fimbriimonadales bacterium]|nr:MAG: hypothetical protein KatS3mg018_0150 [Fimbriimonadales bacterium]